MELDSGCLYCLNHWAGYKKPGEKFVNFYRLVLSRINILHLLHQFSQLDARLF
jgi:hypothetical protein